MTEAEIRRVLVVDDEEVMLSILEEVLSEDGYQVTLSRTAKEAMDILEQDSFDLALIDKNLSDRSGVDLLRWLRDKGGETEVIVITGYGSLESALETIRLGAFDYLLKPFESLEGVRRRIRNAIERREIAAMNRELLEELRESNVRIQRAYEETLQVLARAVEGKDQVTRDHIENVKDLSLAVGRKLGLNEDELRNLRFGSILHDIGKVGVSTEILKKREKLTEEEYRHLQSHVEIGTRIVRGIDFLKDVVPMVKCHHERYDGSGYPDGMKGDVIPLGARIIAVVDAFDAMIANRPYHPEKPVRDALDRLMKLGGTHFDPQVVGALVEVAQERGLIGDPVGPEDRKEMK